MDNSQGGWKDPITKDLPPIPPPPLAPPCSHEFEHLETIKNTEGSGGYNTKFTKVDRFFCKKCLQSKEIKKETYSREAPEWY